MEGIFLNIMFLLLLVPWAFLPLKGLVEWLAAF